ncbi:MAG TPA: NADH-quinone oxidoreductase subunit J [Thermoanaerobaculia bacterium]|nr:NADH-quinone oxidoreductase subunit J [Thermoanaerobaculia bacterium]
MTDGVLLTGGAGWLFAVFAALALASAVAVVAARSPVHSALFLLLSFVLVAAIFILQQAEFVGAVQMLVYAGGIMVLFLFVVMLVNPGVTRVSASFQSQFDVALVLLPVFLLPFLYILGTEKLPDVPVKADAFRMVGQKVVGNTEAVSWVLFRDYLVPFEVASVFLLVAMVGAVVLGKRTLEKMD